MTTLALAVALLRMGHPSTTDADKARARILASTIIRAADAHGVDVAILAAVAAHETTFKRDHVGAAGERGIFQVLPATARLLGYRGSDEALAADPLNAGYAAAWLATVRAVCAKHGHTSEAAFVNAYRGDGCKRKPGRAWPTRYARLILDLAGIARAAGAEPPAPAVATRTPNGTTPRQLTAERSR